MQTGEMQSGIDIQEERRKAHLYLDDLSDSQIAALKGLLEVMLSPAALAMADAPEEDEEISEEEEKAVEVAREWLKHNKPIPNAVVLGDFGLTEEDFERMGKTPLPSNEQCELQD